MRVLKLGHVLPLIGLAAGCDRSADSFITLRPDSTYQTIVGWESHTQSGEWEIPSFPLYSDTLFDMAVDWLGITRLRLEAFSGIENGRDYWTEMRRGEIDAATWRCVRFATENDDDDPDHIAWEGFHFSQFDNTVEKVVIPIRDRLAARGEDLYLNVNYDAFVHQCPNTPYHHLEIDEYAEFALAVFLHLRDKYDIVPDGWEMILEPEHTDWTGRTIGEAMVRTGRLLAEHGFHPEFIAPSNTEAAAAIRTFDEMIQVPGVLEYLDEFSYHRYRGPERADIVEIGERAVRYGVRTAMLEHIGSGHEDLYEDLAIGRNSAWQQFALAYGGRTASENADNGGVYYRVDASDPNNPVLITGSRTHFLRQYFRYIRPGAVRIGAGSTHEAHEPLVFINRDGGNVVVVKSARGGELHVIGLTPGRYAVTYTTERERAVVSAAVPIAPGDTLHTAIPAAGVLTVHPDTIP